jgi:16S rRNA (guanine966-N2)-methyltransferase
VLEIADAPGLRPTPERIRETVFNWLAPRIEGAACLDLFAGTGALGLEALSRGASRAVFVEKSRHAAAALERNVAALDAAGATIVGADAFRFLAEDRGGPFDVVFLDPPFAADRTAELCRLLGQGRLLADGAVVYAEEDRSRPPAAMPDGWRVLRSRTAGNVRYSLLDTGVTTEE